jgi:hypothetical protein
MKVLARIPAIDTNAPALTAVVVGEAPLSPAAAGMPEVSRPRRAPPRARFTRSGFPSGSVLTLAILAAVVWSLASWNDTRRAEHSRLERLARAQPAAAIPETISR